MKVKVGDLVRWRDQIFLVLDVNPLMAFVANVRREGTTNGLKPQWLEVISESR